MTKIFIELMVALNKMVTDTGDCDHPYWELLTRGEELLYALKIEVPEIPLRCQPKKIE